MTQPILCPRCHKPGNATARYCGHCGFDMVLNNPGPRYFITQVLKQGGQGAVYAAIGEDGKTYAVKEMIDRFDEEQERVEGIARFKTEARLLQRLGHPRIPRVYADFEDEQRHYLAMDFVVGEDLEDVVAREGALPEPQVLAWADQISDVLGYLHSSGLIYRDMKPSNVMIDAQNGGIKLVDFGIAKILQPAVRGTQIGTPGYAPPEQYQGIATPASDIFALAATLHHLLTGRDPTQHPPFSFPAVRDLQLQVSRRTADAIQRALQMKPEDRFQTVAEFRTALGFRPGTATKLVGLTTSPGATATTTGTPPVATAAATAASHPRAGAVPQPQPARVAAPPQPTAKPAPARKKRGPLTCVSWILSIVIVLGIAGVFYFRSMFSVPTSPAATPTFVQQPFTANGLEIIIQVEAADITEEVLSQNFSQAFAQVARAQYGEEVQIQPETLRYLEGPVEIGQEDLGVLYRASVQGDILIPEP